MKKITLFILTAIAAISFAACGGPAANSGANNANATNANAAAKPAAAAPTKEALMGIENKAWEAWKAKDVKFFEEMLADNTISLGEKGREDKAAIVKSIADPTCDVKSFSLSEDQMTALGADAALITYKATQDGKCGGKALPGTVWAASVFVRSGDAWKAAYHNEIPVADPKAAPAKPAPAKPAAETKPAADAKPADAATEALLTIEKKAWDAWKARDIKGVDGVYTKDFSIIDDSGRHDYAGTMKLWFESKCEVKSYSLSDAASTSVTKDMSIITYKAAASGTCDGQPLGSIWATTVYVKEGESWKGAFYFSSPA